MPKKIALISHAFPPSWSGQAVILGRILRQLDPASYHLISSQDYNETDTGFIPRLPGAYHHLPPEYQVSQNYFPRQLLKFNIAMAALVRGRRVARILKSHACQAVIACSGDIADLPAGWVASRLAGVPFIPYLFDDFTYQWPAGVHREMASFFERFIFRNPAAVIVPNELLRDEINQRHGVSCSIVRNCCDDPHLPAKELPSLDNGQPINIVFTGAIYHMNFSSFRMLAQAVARLERSQVKLHLYTATKPEVLAEQDILGPQVEHHGHVPSDQVNQVQQEADLLFVPFAFDTPVWELAKTSAPGKLGDYMASGTPILGMAPPDSFTTWYLRKHHAGLVVDRDSPDFLDETLTKLLFDDELRRMVSANARRQAKVDFSPNKAVESLLAILQMSTQNTGQA